MKISKIINNIEVINIQGSADIKCSNIYSDSRNVTRNSMFIAIKGFDSDGHEYIEQAIEKGANCIIYEDEKWRRECSNITWVLINNVRKSVSTIASNFYEDPSSKLNLIGVTGTNGKTTIATLLYDLFSSLGYGCGLLSTIHNKVISQVFHTNNTTSDPISINYLLSMMVESGCEYCFMEVSSHAIDQERISNLHFKGGIFTNITHDHLDYHKSFAEYIKCKKSFFDTLPKTAFALTNSDDKNGGVMVQNTKAKIYTYSSRSIADFKVKILEMSIEGSLINIEGKEVWTKLFGDYNASNLLAVYATAILLGAVESEVLVCLSNLNTVQGRLEYFKSSNGVTAIVDFAHTPDALENVLSTLKKVVRSGKIISVFGCGGDRDRTKRPKMAQMGAIYSDKMIITSDNPRFEDPNQIINDMKEGISSAELSKILTIIDRKEAIRTALMMAEKGDIVLVAGKGHENYQIINGVKSHFSDQELVLDFFKN